MVNGGYPSVYTVDTHATQHRLPPRLGQARKSTGAAQTVLILLVSLALCGMVIEAYFIYCLYQPETALSASSAKHTAGEEATSPTQQPSYGILPSKPVAHLTDGQDAVHGKHIMSWSMTAEPLLYEMDYKHGNLIIQKEGYYYVYSKVFFSDSGLFHHHIDMVTEMYAGENITLLQARKYSPDSTPTRSNSYLGGVFHLYKNDAIHVRVSDTAKIERHKSYENVFGAFMI